jgi:1-deoxy-D-xylulose-5-phosphate synthase
MVATQVAIDDACRRCAIRRGEGVGVDMPTEGKPLEIGKGRIVREGSKIAILSLGTRLAGLAESRRRTRLLWSFDHGRRRPLSL